MNPYEKLNVPTDANSSDIKQAYKRMAQKHHPDRPDGSEDEYHAIKLAYDVLRDPERRQRYDDFGDTEEAPKGNIPEQMIMNSFNQLIDKDDLKGNVIDRVVEHIKSQKDEAKNEAAKAKNKLKSLEKKMNRIKAKGDNLFEGLLTQKIEGFSRSIEQSKVVIGNFDKALELLADYEDSAPEVITTVTFTTNTSGLGGLGTGQSFFKV